MPALGASPQPHRDGDIRPRRSPPPSWTPARTLTIEAPLDLVIACGPGGAVLHPGGYRLSLPALQKPGVLARDLEAIVLNHALIDPSVRPRPRLEFLVEAGGIDTYKAARRQTTLAGLNWPVTLRLAGPLPPEPFPKERF
jgi:hypothetical protein